MGTTIELRLNPETGNYEATATPSEGDGGGELSQAGVFGGAAEFNFGGVPVGAAIIGGLSAGFFDALISLFPVVDIPGIEIPTNIRRGIILFIASWAAQTEPVRNFLGRSGAEAASLILAADGVQEFINLRGILSGIVGGGQLNQSTHGILNPTLVQQGVPTAQRTDQQMTGTLFQVPGIALGRQALAGL